MPITHQWVEPNIIYYVFDGKWSGNDVLNVFENTRLEIDALPAKAVSVFDFSRSKLENTPELLHKLARHFEPASNIRAIVLINANPLIKSAASIGIRLLPQSKIIPHLAKSYDHALEIAHQILEGKMVDRR